MIRDGILVVVYYDYYYYADGLIQQEPKSAYLCYGNYNVTMAVNSGDEDTNCGKQWLHNIECGIIQKMDNGM